MSKLLMLIDDNVDRLDKMLLSIQSIFCLANKKNLNNAPKNNEIEICVLNTINKNGVENNNRFFEICRILEARQQNTEGMPVIPISLITLKLDFDNYPNNCEELSEIIVSNIEEKIELYDDYYILLDTALYNEKDFTAVLSGTVILSQKIYNIFYEKCMPYTVYDSDGKEFLRKWSENVINNTLPFERYRFESNAVFKPFCDKLYEHFRIGE